MDVDAETILKKHQRSTKSKYMWTLPNGEVFGTNNPDEIEEVRQAVIARLKDLEPDEFDDLEELDEQ